MNGWILTILALLIIALLYQLYYACFVFSSRSFWTSSSLDVPAGVTQEEGHTGFLIHLLSAVCALIFLVRRIQPFLSLVDREVEFRVTIYILHPLGIFILFFYFSEKNPVLPGSNPRSNGSEGYEVTSELPGRPVYSLYYTSSIILLINSSARLRFFSKLSLSTCPLHTDIGCHGPGDICWGTTVRNKDEELKTFWESMVRQNIGWGDCTRRL